MPNLWTMGLLGAVLASGAAPADAKSPPGETIIVRFRAPYAICAGVCPNYTITVPPSGEVQTTDDFEGEAWSFRVNRRQLRRFHKILDTIRPQGVRRLDQACVQARRDDGSLDELDDPRPDDVEVRWIGPNGSDSITSCAYTHPAVRDTVSKAVVALGAAIALGVPERLIFPE